MHAASRRPRWLCGGGMSFSTQCMHAALSQCLCDACALHPFLLTLHGRPIATGISNAVEQSAHAPNRHARPHRLLKPPAGDPNMLALPCSLRALPPPPAPPPMPPLPLLLQLPSAAAANIPPAVPGRWPPPPMPCPAAPKMLPDPTTALPWPVSTACNTPQQPQQSQNCQKACRVSTAHAAACNYSALLLIHCMPLPRHSPQTGRLPSPRLA